MMLYTYRNKLPFHGKLNGTSGHQKLSICLEPTVWLIVRQSRSCQWISYPVQLDKNQKLLPLLAEHRSSVWIRWKIQWKHFIATNSYVERNGGQKWVNDVLHTQKWASVSWWIERDLWTIKNRQYAWNQHSGNSTEFFLKRPIQM